MHDGQVLYQNTIWIFGRYFGKYKNKFAHIICLLVVFISFSGCTYNPVPEDFLVACGSFSIPGMFCEGLKGGTYQCKVLEEDRMGRILYNYTTYNSLTDCQETVTIICQGYDKEYVYYYEDQCYLRGSAAASDISQLKEANDWGKPLDHDKMSRREVIITSDRWLNTNTDFDYMDSRFTCCQKLHIQYEQINDLYISDADGAGNSLYVLEIDRDGLEDCYLALFDKSGNVALHKIEDHQLTTQDLAEFKQENGWVYGY